MYICVVYTQKQYSIIIWDVYVLLFYYLFIYDVLGILVVDDTYIAVISFSFLFHIYDVQRIINVDGAHIYMTVLIL